MGVPRITSMYTDAIKRIAFSLDIFIMAIRVPRTVPRATEIMVRIRVFFSPVNKKSCQYLLQILSILGRNKLKSISKFLSLSFL